MKAGSEGDAVTDQVIELPEAASAVPAALVGIGRRVADGLDALLPTMGAAYQREVAEYAAMAPADFQHVLETSRAFVARFVESLAAGEGHPMPDHGRLGTAGRRRQEAGVSLDAAMHAFRIASRVGWTAISDVATAIDPLLVGEVAARWIEYADRAATAFAEGHTSGTTEQLRRLDARRQALVSDLLDCDDDAAAQAVAAGHGLRLSSAHFPVVVAGGDPFAILERVQPHLPAGTLTGRRGEHVVALVAAGSTIAQDAIAASVTDAVVVSGRPVRFGAPMAQELASLVSVARVAVATGRTGTVGRDELLLDRLVDEDTAVADALRRRVVQPLAEADPDGVFRQTLAAYLRSGVVSAVAEELYVHANTVTYRLRRVREVTSLDPRVPEDAAHLVLALRVDAMDRARPSDLSGAAIGVADDAGAAITAEGADR